MAKVYLDYDAWLSTYGSSLNFATAACVVGVHRLVAGLHEGGALALAVSRCDRRLTCAGARFCRRPLP